MPAIPQGRQIALVLAAATLPGAIIACGLLAPSLLQPLLAAPVVLSAIILVLRFPAFCSVVWLLVAGMSLEMAFSDLIGEAAFQPTIAVVKGAEIGLAALCMLRFGPNWDPLCPAWAFPVMLALGFVHGLYPGLSMLDSLRSAIGSIAPFAFCFCRVPGSWSEAILRATKWCPVVAVLACLPLAATGIRPLFVESGGARLAGLGHPAFLASVCLPAIYACLIQLYRAGRRGDLVLLLANFLILILTGARAPFAYAAAVTGLSLASLRSTVFAAGDRILLALSALALVPVLMLLAGDLQDIRLFNVVLHETTNLSGRRLLWPNFEDAAAQSPWFGWGVGAGNVVIPPTGPIAQMLQTWAAHNEYLRIEVEGGLVGRTLLIGLFVAWVGVHTRGLPSTDRRIMRLAFVAFACHAVTDNLLISTPACVFFAFVAAVFARSASGAVPGGCASRSGMALPDSRLVA